MNSDTINQIKITKIKPLRLPYFIIDKPLHKVSKSSLYQNYNNLFKSSPIENQQLNHPGNKSIVSSFNFLKINKKKTVNTPLFEEFKTRAKHIFNLTINDNNHHIKTGNKLKNYATLSHSSQNDTINQPNINSNSFRKCLYFDKKFHLKDKLEQKYKYAHLLKENLKKDESYHAQNKRIKIINSTPQRIYNSTPQKNIRIQFSNEYIKELLEKNNE